MYDGNVPRQIDPSRTTRASSDLPAREVELWPVAGTETDLWVPSSAGLYTKRERQIQTGSYRRAVVPEIARAYPRVSAEVTARIEEATAEIVRFDAELGFGPVPFLAIL